MSLLAPAEICLVDHLTANDIDLPPVRLVDVGCSGGIYPAWRRWRDRLSALGIDVITDEVDAFRKARRTRMSTILQRAPDETHQQRRLKGFAQRPTPYTARKRISRPRYCGPSPAPTVRSSFARSGERSFENLILRSKRIIRMSQTRPPIPSSHIISSALAPNAIRC